MSTGCCACARLRSFVLMMTFGVLATLSFGPLAIGQSASPQPVVEFDDENQDGVYDGRDVELALVRCRPGCLLRAGPHTYHDVAVVLDKHFPNGVTIEGSGIGETVFKSPVPVRAPIFWQKGGQPGAVFRNFSLDGRKTEQTNASQISDSVGIRVSDLSLRPSDGGRIESVAIAHFLTAGVLIRNGRGWQVRKNQISDIGCHTNQPCPLMPGDDADPHVKGRRTVGYGIMLTGVGASDAIVEANRVANVSKIGIEAFSNRAKLGSPKRVRNVRFLRNRVSGAVSAGITSNGGVEIQIVGNEVWDSGGPGLIGNGGAGISCGGPSEKIVIAQNVVHDTDGAGLRVGCKGDDVTVRANRIERACRRSLIEQGAIQVVGGKPRSRGISIAGNDVQVAEGGCVYAMLLVRWNDVEISDGSYTGGSRSALYVGDASSVRLERLRATAGRSPALFIRRDVEGITIGHDVRFARGSVTDAGATNVIFETVSPRSEPRRSPAR